MEACGSPVALTSGYGLSETFSVSTVDYTPGCFDKNYSRAAVDVGYPFPGVTVGVFDPDGNELGYGERGEIRIKTDSMTTGYINDPEYTQAKLKDGWLLTEDCGELDERGKLFVYGRMSQHLLAPGGEKVYLFDIANLLREDPAVKMPWYASWKRRTVRWWHIWCWKMTFRIRKKTCSAAWTPGSPLSSPPGFAWGATGRSAAS